MEKPIKPQRQESVHEADKNLITVEAVVNAPIEKVWKMWTEPAHIVSWNHASDDWHTLRVVNDLREGGRFNYRMEAKDGSFGFDFDGQYNNVLPRKRIDYTMADGRKVQVSFSEEDKGTRINEVFEAENTHSLEMQKDGWQAILNNFKKHAEANT